jgi:hypothetical protein
MLEPTTIASAVFSGFNSLIKAVTLAAHYKDVPNEVKQLHTNIQRAERSINIAERLIRRKGHYLDRRLIKDTDESITATQDVALLLRNSIEACRKDLELSKTVKPKNRLVWLLWKNQEFLNQLQTLSNCLTALDREIVRLEMAHPPIVVVSGSPVPPAYPNKERNEGEVTDKEAADERLGFPRSPTRRVLRSRTRNGSQSSIRPLSNVKQSSHHQSPQLENRDEGYEPGPARPHAQGSNLRRTADHEARDLYQRAAAFPEATLTLGTRASGIAIPPGQINARQGRVLQQHPAWTPPSAEQVFELSDTSNTFKLEQVIQSNNSFERAFSSKNPWRSFAPQPSTSTLNSLASVPQNHVPGAWQGTDNVATAHSRPQTNVRQDYAMDTEPLDHVVPAPDVQSWGGSTDTLNTSDAGRSPMPWRRRSDFI